MVGLLLLTAMGSHAQEGASIPVERRWAFAFADEGLLTVVAAENWSCQPGTGFGCAPGFPFPGADYAGFCFGRSVPLQSFHFIFKPSTSTGLQESEIRQWHGKLWIKLYEGGAADIADFEDDPCSFIESGPILAEGPIQWAENDNDVDLNNPGIGAFGWHGHGFLPDDYGLCSDGNLRFDLVRKWHVVSDTTFTDVTLRSAKGPSLTCHE